MLIVVNDDDGGDERGFVAFCPDCDAAGSEVDLADDPERSGQDRRR
ncbi:hypothetical protein H7X46_28115 [Pseudonocardia sp. C8]|nr:hypothetical protein [Pseudonocardia sp. C8]MBC3194923.1 hypothetical protein [Pseudonocardia sp. C8]